MLLRYIQDGGQNGVWNIGHSMSTQPELPGWPFYLADFCTKYSMAFWEVISNISTLCSHWLPRYEQFSIMGVGRFWTRLRNRATKSLLQASVSSLNNLHQQNCHPTVNCTQISVQGRRTLRHVSNYKAQFSKMAAKNSFLMSISQEPTVRSISFHCLPVLYRLQPITWITLQV